MTREVDSESGQIELIVSRNGDNVHLIWEQPNRWSEEYCVEFEQLENLSANLRGLLDQLNAFAHTAFGHP
jgi:hypothetical protein